MLTCIDSIGESVCIPRSAACNHSLPLELEKEEGDWHRARTRPPKVVSGRRLLRIIGLIRVVVSIELVEGLADLPLDGVHELFRLFV